jgi:hypothetical protein
MKPNPLLPTEADINVYDTLDEQYAVRNFLGKTHEQALELFRDNALHYQEDLTVMGAVGFCFYVDAFIAYLKGEESADDSDAASCFCFMVEQRLRIDSKTELRPSAPKLIDAITYLLEHFEKFHVTPHIYGDVPSRLVAARDRLSEYQPRK